MKLNITTDRFGNENHTGEVFPGAGKREFAYQGEGGVTTSVVLAAHPPARGAGKLNWSLEDSKYSYYELVLQRHTHAAVTVQLIGYRKDIIEQRKATGRAVLRDVLLTGMSFGELVNLIFSAHGAQVMHDKEAFPECVAEVMRRAYDKA